jgi:light-independent protochlorophyllide reductase subunit B
MKLAYWMYAGPAHIGTLRVASSFQNVHAIMHAPLGDDYFNVMRSMLERERDFTPVTASIVDRHVLARGSQEKVILNIQRKGREEDPDLILLTPTCTSSILQEDLQNFVNRASETLGSDILLADVNHYRVNELQAADRTLEQIVRFYIEKAQKDGTLATQKTAKPSANIIGNFTLGFHHHHDLRELSHILSDLGVEVNEVIPENGSVKRLKNLTQAWFNIVPYREIGLMAAQYLEKEFGIPFLSKTPMGIVETGAFIRDIGLLLKSQNSLFVDVESYIQNKSRFLSQSAWFSRSIDCQNLTGKRGFVFGDATHASAMTKILAREMGIRVCCAGTYCKHDADWFREEVEGFCDEVLITDDHTKVKEKISLLQPAVLFGSQMERHIGKRYDIPCGVISAPVHIQNFPLGYKPFLGFEGTNQIADLVYNSFTLGMEDHLLEIFGGHDTKDSEPSKIIASDTERGDSFPIWTEEGIGELKRIPGFVRGKIKNNTERFAKEMGIHEITLEVLYAAKEAIGA